MADGFIIESISKKSFQQIDDFKKKLVESIKLTNEWSKELKGVRLPSDVVTAYKRTTTAIKQTNQTLNDYEKQVRALENAQKKHIQATNEVARQTAKLRVDTQELNKANKQQAVLTSKLTTEYQKEQVKLTLLRKKYADLQLKQELGVKLSKQELATLKATQIAINKKATALANVDAKMKIYSRNVGNYKSALSGLKGGLLSLVGAFGLTSGVFLFAGAVKDAFNRVREFDKAMQNIAGIMRTSRKDIKDLERVIINVASTSVKTSVEVAKLAETLVTLGEGKESVKQLLKPVNDLSIGLGTTSEEAGAFLINMLNAFGASRDEAGKYADVIATIRTSTSLDFQKMRDSFQYLAPISRILNKDLAYTGSVIGILADNGIKAERAGRLLGTAQQKLAKEGKTLADALKEVNDASKNGVKEQELLKIASELFGKQASAIGAILAQNTDLIDTNAEAIRNNSGALKDLTEQQLDSIDGKLNMVNSSYERFILNLDNGNNVVGRIIKAYLELFADGFDKLGVVLDTNTGFFERFAVIINAYTSGFDGGFFSETTNELIRKQKGLLEDETIAINSLNQAYIDLNGTLAPFTQLQDKMIENSNLLYTATTKKTTGTIGDLRKEISQLRAELDNTDKTDKDAIKTTQNKIKQKTAELNSILGITKAVKTEEKAIKGTIKYYQEQISIAENLQKTTVKTRREYELYQTQIDSLKDNILNLTEGYDRLYKKLQQDRQKTDPTKVIDEVIKKNDEEFAKYAENEKNKQALKDKAKREEEFAQQQIKNAFISLGNTLGIQQSTVSELFDGLTNGFQDAGEAAQVFGGLFSDVINRMTQDSAKRTQERINMLQKEKDVALQFAGDNAEARGRIEERYNEKIKRLKTQQAKREKENAIIQSIINTAIAVTKTFAELGIAGIVPASIVGALGLAETAIIASQPLPQFKDGVKGFEGGKAIINEVRDEVVVTDKGIARPKGRNLLVDLPKGADVYPSEDAFMRELGHTLMLNDIDLPKKEINLKGGLTKSQMQEVLNNTLGNIPMQKTVLDKNGITSYFIANRNKTISLNNRINQKGISV